MATQPLVPLVHVLFLILCTHPCWIDRASFVAAQGRGSTGLMRREGDGRFYRLANDLFIGLFILTRVPIQTDGQ